MVSVRPEMSYLLFFAGSPLILRTRSHQARFEIAATRTRSHQTRFEIWATRTRSHQTRYHIRGAETSIN